MTLRFDDSLVRTAVFDWLAKQVEIHGDVLPRAVLEKGLEYGGRRVPLVGPQGIFKPQVLESLPISITTAPSGPYNDSFGSDGLLRYRYRGTNPDHPDNRSLRSAMTQRVPLVHFHGVIQGRYLATWPVFIVSDDVRNLTFTVAVDDATYAAVLPSGGQADVVAEDARREYITSIVKRRLHQRAFRERVLQAYQNQCALCRLRHEELLDAAHIIPDPEPEGEPVVRNGLALCKLHHSVFDNNFLGIRPDYVVEVRRDLLEESDGPTLVHLIQGLHGSRILIPRHRALQPGRDLLEIRYERFRRAG